MPTSIDVTVNGRRLALDALYGDVEMSKVWPGGSGEMSWTVDAMTTHRGDYHGGNIVRGWFGPVCVFGGQLVEPDPSQDRMVAEGLWRAAEKFPALDGSDNATTVPDTAIDHAITLGLPWTRPTSISTTAVDLDTTQGPVTLAELLDAYTEQTMNRWGVNPLGEVVQKVDDTIPSLQINAIEDGLGFATDTYASGLVGRYKTSTGYATAIRTNATAQADHGPAYTVVDLTPRGVLTSTKANAILDNMLALGRAVPQWTTGIEVTYGELLGPGGTPVALESVSASSGLLRIHGGFDLAQRLNGALYLDIPIGETSLSAGTLILKPQGLAARSLVDVLADFGNAAHSR